MTTMQSMQNMQKLYMIYMFYMVKICPNLHVERVEDRGCV